MVGLHRAAAAWAEAHGLADDAVRHALAAGDAIWAARLIERHADELICLRGEGPTVQRWLAMLPAELVRSRPRLCLAQTLMALVVTWRRSRGCWMPPSALERLPRSLCRSLTWDHGKEMAEHARFTADADIPVFFCDPRSPWQRASNENANGLARQYLPRTAEVSRHSRP